MRMVDFCDEYGVGSVECHLLLITESAGFFRAGALI